MGAKIGYVEGKNLQYIGIVGFGFLCHYTGNGRRRGEFQLKMMVY